MMEKAEHPSVRKERMKLELLHRLDDISKLLPDLDRKDILNILSSTDTQNRERLRPLFEAGIKSLN